LTLLHRVQTGTEGYLLGIKVVSECSEANGSSPAIAQVKNQGNHNSTSQYAFLECTVAPSPLNFFLAAPYKKFIF
jgi:hypothetical protein